MTAGSATAPFGDPPPPDVTRHSTAGRTMVDSRVYSQALRRAQAAEAALDLARLRAGLAEAVAARAIEDLEALEAALEAVDVARQAGEAARAADGAIDLGAADPDFADWTPLPAEPGLGAAEAGASPLVRFAPARAHREWP